MSKPCSICEHPKRTQIETEIINGTPYRSIAEWYNVGRSAISRHKNEGHLNTALVKAADPAVIAEDATLQDQLRDIHARTLRILQDAESSGDVKVALVAIRECRSNLEFLAKLELLLSERAAARQEQEDRNIVFTYPDDTVEAEAVKVLRRRGYIVSRPGGIFQYPGDANLSDKLVGDLDKLCRGYIEQLEQGERVDLSGKSTAERVGYLLALVSGASLVLPSDGRNKSNDNLVVGGD